MAGEATEYKVEELPRFDALRDYLGATPARDKVLEWVEKLEGWCRAAQAELKRHESHVEDLDDKLTDAQKEIEKGVDAKEAFERLMDDLLDVEREILTVDELIARHRT